MTDINSLVEKIALAAMARFIIPVATWGGRGIIRIAQSGTVGSVAVVSSGLIATVIVAARPEATLDFVLRQIATVTETTGLVLSLAANKIRALEKTDLEALINKPLDQLFPVIYELPSEQLLIAPLLPKDYSREFFPYYISPLFLPRFVGIEEYDRLIRAYNDLGIDVVAMILQDHQLPQLDLVRDIYREAIRQQHPDKTGSAATTGAASTLNVAYGEIQATMKGAGNQYELIRAVLQKFNKTAFPSIPYVYLFAGGVVIVLLLTS